MNDTDLATTLEREYFAICEGTPGFADKTTLRKFLHSRGFPYQWLTDHDYTDENYSQGRFAPKEQPCQMDT